MLFVLLAYLALTSASDWKSELQDPWKSAIAQGSVVGGGRIKRLVQLDDKDPNNKNEVACDLPDGMPGICKSKHLCMQEDFKTNFNKFTDHLCILGNSQIGLCCADKSEEFGSLKLAGDLPAIAMQNEDQDVLLKISKAENRGCGFSTRPRDKLVGSGPGKLHEWPWMASISNRAKRLVKNYCGGTLITDRHVLTAAHCLINSKIDDLNVRLGEYDFDQNNESRSYVFKVIEKIEHEEFQHTIKKNDIAILKLDRPATFNTYVWPACLPPVGLELVNKTVLLTGWGTIRMGGPTSSVLLEAAMPIWDQKTCTDLFADAIFDENYCASSYNGGKDACTHDSGGPLMYQMPSGRWATVGVVSWGLGCGRRNHPGVYTRIDKYLPWILANTRY